MTTEIASHGTGYKLIVNPDGSITFGERTLSTRIENTVQGMAVYIGKAVPGTLTSAESWQIQKLTYSGNFVTAIGFAGGSAAFDKKWDDRATYSYS